MRTKLLILLSAGLAIMLGCVETTSVETPGTVNPDCTFQVIVNTVLVESPYPEPCLGVLAVLHPIGWVIDSAYCNGYGYSGPMVGPYPGSYMELPPPSAGYEWHHFYTPDNDLFGEPGDTGFGNVFILPNDSLGTFSLAFLAGALGGIGDPVWSGDPCSCSVEVTPLSLEQETWGNIKAGF